MIQGDAEGFQYVSVHVRESLLDRDTIEFKLLEDSPHLFSSTPQLRDS